MTVIFDLDTKNSNLPSTLSRLLITFKTSFDSKPSILAHPYIAVKLYALNFPINLTHISKSLIFKNHEIISMNY